MAVGGGPCVVIERIEMPMGDTSGFWIAATFGGV